MAGKEILFAVVAIIVGSGLGYFWHISRPSDPIELVVGVGIVAIGLFYFALQSIGKH